MHVDVGGEEEASGEITDLRHTTLNKDILGFDVLNGDVVRIYVKPVADRSRIISARRAWEGWEEVLM
jgi:hypothetical protein